MNTLILLAALSCPAPELVGFKSKMTDNDEKALKQASKRCGELYKNSPCIIKFELSGENNYKVTCGAKR